MTTRRQFNLLLSGFLLASTSAYAQGPAPRPGGELVFALDGAAVVKFVLDPHNSGFAPHNRVFRSIYDSLVVLLPNQKAAPWLATSWEISPDQKTYTFKLRSGVKFHDGTPFNAAAVKFNLDRIADRKNALTALQDLGTYAGSEVLTDDTIRVTLSEPYAPLLHNLAKTTLGIVSPAAIARHGDLIGQNPVGTGPFRFVSLTQGTEIKLERNADYSWAPPTAAHNGPAYLERLTFKNVPEESTRVAALQSRQVHAADAIPPQSIAAIKADESLRFVDKELIQNNYALYLNAAKAPWDDEEIRKAVQLSLDLDTIVKVIYLGTQPRAWAPLSPSMFGSNDKALAKSWAPDAKRAAQIFEARGWRPGRDGIREKDGKRLVISFIDTQGNREKRLDVIQLARRQLQRNGIDLTIDSQPQGTYQQKVSNGDFDLAASSQFAADPDVLNRLHLPGVRPATTSSKVNDPEITGWLTAATREGDEETRIELYEKVQRKLIEKAYAIPVYVLLYNIATTGDVAGIRFDALGFPEFHDTWLSK
jgi:peptide/nickel transport system substrate-binding protein